MTQIKVQESLQFSELIFDIKDFPRSATYQCLSDKVFTKAWPRFVVLKRGDFIYLLARL